MFVHNHPYKPFIQQDTKTIIVGTLPPPRFSKGELFENDVDFCYGSYYNSLWKYIDVIHNLNLSYNNSQKAIEERKTFLIRHQIGICDIVQSAVRKKVDASDLGMTNIKLRDLIGYIKKYPSVETLLFTGGNSKNGPEYFFRKHLKTYNLKLETVVDEVPRIHKFTIPSSMIIGALSDRVIKTVSLTSASGSANRAIGSMPLYKQLKQSNPSFSTFDFRVMQYSEFI